uniref:Uncharacterized protein n=1 Tax=Arundo donax TaxID=35708 RepID=A0A0A9GWN8_ARUDO
MIVCTLPLLWMPSHCDKQSEHDSSLSMGRTVGRLGGTKIPSMQLTPPEMGRVCGQPIRVSRQALSTRHFGIWMGKGCFETKLVTNFLNSYSCKVFVQCLVAYQ